MDKTKIEISDVYLRETRIDLDEVREEETEQERQIRRDVSAAIARELDGKLLGLITSPDPLPPLTMENMAALMESLSRGIHTGSAGLYRLSESLDRLGPFRYRDEEPIYKMPLHFGRSPMINPAIIFGGMLADSEPIDAPRLESPRYREMARLFRLVVAQPWPRLPRRTKKALLSGAVGRPLGSRQRRRVARLKPALEPVQEARCPAPFSRSCSS